MSVPGVRAYAASDVGLVRKGNEDSYFRGATVFAVADGMGGHLAGEVASRAALEPLRELDGQDLPDDQTTAERLVQAIEQANVTVVREAGANPDYRGMGTTLTAVLVREGRLHVAHVGDSRAYLLRPGEGITQLTTDHTLVEQLVQEGRLSRDQAAVHPQRSVITRAIGVDADVQVDLLPPIALQPGDQVLLCSDGLSGPVDDDTIADILLATEDGQEACEHLINAAIDAGGPDNITVVLLRVEADAGSERGSAPVVGGAAAIGGGPGTGVLTGRDTERHDTAPLAVTAPPGPAAQPTEAPHPEDARELPDDEDVGYAYGASAPRRPRSPARRVSTVLLASVLVVGLGTAVGWALLSRAYFVGVSDGRVAVFNGLPQEVASLPLYWLAETSDVVVADLPPRFQHALAEGITVGSLSEARRTVADYRADVAERRAAASEQPSPAPTASPTPDSAVSSSPDPSRSEDPRTADGIPTPTPSGAPRGAPTSALRP